MEVSYSPLSCRTDINENYDLAGGIKYNYKSLDEKKLSDNLR